MVLILSTFQTEILLILRLWAMMQIRIFILTHNVVNKCKVFSNLYVCAVCLTANQLITREANVQPVVSVVKGCISAK